MTEEDWLAERFEEHRTRLRGVAYRMLGSLGEAEDAVQETWLRLRRADASGVDNLAGWLTTVVGRVCLDMLRSRTSRREDPAGVHIPDPVVTPEDGSEPEREALLGDAVGMALLVVIETLSPAERLAFVLHDVFAVPFEEIAPIVERTPAAARQLASRARRRVQGTSKVPQASLAHQREVVDAFVAASREGDITALLAVLDPEVVLRLDRGDAPAGGSKLVRGADGVVGLGFRFSGPGWLARPARVNGAAGIVVTYEGRPMAVIGFTVNSGRITGIDILADPKRVRGLDLAFLARPAGPAA
jgi:RNA polymerase sigma-70 factor (ECF subfamily)